MISVSDKFLEIVNSNVRPPIKPTITVSGTDVNDNKVSLTWKSNNIIDMSYKRSIDPTGQTLPYMELTWKEFYFGKLNAQNYPEKYENLVKYMAVNLSFTQKITNFNTWGDLKTKTWGDLKNLTWGEVFKSDNSETVTLPTMFLVAKPVAEGHTITWTARDLLYFLNENVSHCFNTGIPWVNPIRWLFLNEIGNFTRNFDIINGLAKSQIDAEETTSVNTTRTMDNLIIFEGSTKNLLKNSALTQSCYFDFKENYVMLKRFLTLVSSSARTPVFKFTKKIMREHPKLTANADISSFSINRYVVQIKEDEEYSLEPTEILTYTDDYGNELKYGRYFYKGYGRSTAQSSTLGGFISKDAYNKVTDGEDNSIIVTPVEANSVTQFWDNTDKKKTGEMYVEDNPLNYLALGETATVEKLASLNVWYSSDKYSIEVNSLSNIALEMGDLVEVETNLYDDAGNFLTKRAVVVGIEMTYNGTLKQKTFLHEVI